MSADAEFFEELKEWSERKLALLSKYLDASSRILKELYYIDGFAGRGYYGRTGQQLIAGSPIRAAELAHTIRKEQRAYSLHCINIESNRINYDYLVEATQPYSDVTQNLFGPFADQIDSLLSIVGDKPVLCFLDPFGIDGMEMQAIGRLIRRDGAKTDLWVRFDVVEARRREGYFDSTEMSAPKQYDILCRVYGVSDRNQLHAAMSGETPAERNLAARRYYMQRLLEQYPKPDRAFTSSYHIRSIAGESKYWMIAATGHAKGYVLASDILYGIEESYKVEAEWYRENSSGQFSMFADLEPSPEQIAEEKVKRLEELILSKCLNQSMSRLAVHTLILKNGWFGRVTKKHVRAALQNLRDQGKAKANSTRLSEDETIFTFN